MAESKKELLLREHQELTDQRSTWLPHWRELSENMSPRGSRFLVTDVNKGIKRNHKIINGTPLLAVRTQSAGMMSGCSSPSRPWFRLTTHDPDLADYAAVRTWLENAERRINAVFAKSNVYNSLPVVYEDLAVYGTSLMHMDADVKDVIRCYVWRPGQYVLANSPRFEVNKSMVLFRMTVAQLVEQFGAANCSQSVQDMYKNHQLHTWHDVVKVVGPNDDYREGKIGPKGMPWYSLWFERAGDHHDDKFLRQSGYYENPDAAPRWNVTSEDVYGHSPGMNALGDCNQLQFYERKMALAVDKIIDPPMSAPYGLRDASLVPGHVTHVPNNNGLKFEPSVVVPPETVQVGDMRIQRLERKIMQEFYADLWLMLSQSDEGQDPRKTATEVNELKGEKMEQLGPVTDRLQVELLGPLVDRTFNELLRRGMLPPPPQELQGKEVKIDFISVMALAQKMREIGGVQQLTQYTIGLAQARPDALDKLNVDNLVDEMADDLGVKPSLINSDDQVAQMRAARAKQQAQQQQAQMALAATQGAKNLGQANTGDDTALGSLLNSISPVAAGGA